jgi:RNA polymerase sigma-70 factor (ECF subfamily)
VDGMAPHPSSPERLLEHAPRLRFLARQLVLDAHTAEDLVQETWLTALERPAPQGRALREWLATVLRNFALQGRRARERRVEREALVARGEAVQSTADTYERFELLRNLMEAIDGLDEAYRQAILLRYLEGLPPREIARKLELPVRTVKTRLHRGLAQLRARLDRRYGGRPSWISAMAPLMATPPTWSSLVLPTAGAATVSTAAKVALVSFVVITALLTILWQVSRPGARSTEPEQPVVEALRSADVLESEQARVEVARQEVADEAIAKSEAAVAPQAAPAPAEELAKLQEKLVGALETTLHGEMDPGLFLDMALLLVELEPGRVIPEPNPMGMRFPLLDTPAGMQAEFVVRGGGPYDHQRLWGSVLALHASFDKPTIPYLVDGHERRRLEAKVTIWTDASTGAVKHFGVLTNLSFARIAPDGNVADGLLYNLDMAKPFEPSASLGGTKNGQPGSWPVPLSLVGGPWPRFDDIERLSQGLSKMHAKLKQ